MTSYNYRVWTEAGNMVAYVTDPMHEPPQYQKNLEGQEKAMAIDLVTEEKAAAGNDGFYQSTISEAQRLYLRTGKEGGNSWEVKFDENWEEMPWPGDEPAPPPEYKTTLANAVVLVRKAGSRVSIVITGELL